ncbi:MAG: carboxymuconolactone decarboxylase family protein [Pseudomonadota bacterium]
MSIDTLKDQLPDYAKDIRLNLSSLENETVLNDQQKYGTFLATALASRNATVIREIADIAEDKLDPVAFTAAKAAAGIMGMNNIYYRFAHLVSEKNYATMPAKLRMQIIGNPGVDKLDFELWSLAVSAINGCGMCLDSHDAIVRKGGMTSEQVQAAVRIASVVHAAAAIIDGEDALKA